MSKAVALPRVGGIHHGCEWSVSPRVAARKAIRPRPPVALLFGAGPGVCLRRQNTRLAGSILTHHGRPTSPQRLIALTSR
jgi:hypothetical protein